MDNKDNKDKNSAFEERKVRVVRDSALEATQYALGEVTKYFQGFIDQIVAEQTQGQPPPATPEAEVKRQFESAWYESLHGYLEQRFLVQMDMRKGDFLDVKPSFNASADKLSEHEVDILKNCRQKVLESTAFRILNLAEKNKKQMEEGADHIAREIAKGEGRDDGYAFDERVAEISDTIKTRVGDLYREVLDIVLPLGGTEGPAAGKAPPSDKPPQQPPPFRI